MPEEAIQPVYARISAGHLDEDAGYSAYRSHGTDDWLLIHTLAGEGRFGTEDGRELRAAPGQTTLLLPNRLHDYGTAPERGRWAIYFAHFRARSDWRSLLDWPSPAPGIRQLTVTGEVREHVETNLADAVRWSHSLLPQNGLLGLNRLEAALLWCDLANPLARPLDDRIRRAVDMVEQDLARPWTLAGLARIAQLSESRFSHLFAEQIGLTPMEFVEQRRLAWAAQLLDLTARPVASIAAEVGYADALYFSSRFRRRYAMSPRAYRHREIPAGHPS